MGKLTSEILSDLQLIVVIYLQPTIENEWVTHLVYRSCTPPIGLHTNIPIFFGNDSWMVDVLKLDYFLRSIVFLVTAG